jgi:metallo-beta-lactamase family protein
MVPRITFLGAAGNVTGSCYFIETEEEKILVDCGLFQEWKLKDRNWESFPFDPAELTAVILTHAHLDHVGRLPKLVRAGYNGPIYGSKATLAIAGIVLVDAGRLQEEDANYKRKRHKREGKTPKRAVEPLYDAEDAERCMSLFRPLHFNTWSEMAPGIDVHLSVAGHILGAASINMRVNHGAQTTRILFSGDIGRKGAPILRDPTLSDEPVDILLIESTYGNRTHEPTKEIPDRLEEVLKKACEAGGNILIPTFAVERAQDILYHLSYLLEEKKIPPLLVFLDSPMAVKVTEVFKHSKDIMDDDAAERFEGGEKPWAFGALELCRTPDQSKAINQIRGTVIILAGSGMCTGGRIKHHLVRNIERPESTVLFVGYQAENTLGREILRGDPFVRIHGRELEVKAHIERIEGFSAHAGQDELLEWTDMLPNDPKQVFITHGEKDAARELKRLLEEKKGWTCTQPNYREQYNLE